jgi:hypothetical protein
MTRTSQLRATYGAISLAVGLWLSSIVLAAPIAADGATGANTRQSAEDSGDFLSNAKSGVASSLRDAVSQLILGMVRYVFRQ